MWLGPFPRADHGDRGLDGCIEDSRHREGELDDVVAILLELVRTFPRAPFGLEDHAELLGDRDVVVRPGIAHGDGEEAVEGWGYARRDGGIERGGNERCDVGKPAAPRQIAAGPPRQGEGDDAREVQEALVGEMDREGLPLIHGHRMVELPDARGEGAEEHLSGSVVCYSQYTCFDVLANRGAEAVDGDLAAREGLVAEPHGDGDASAGEADWRGGRICGFDLLLDVDGPAQSIDEDVLT